MIKKRLQVQKIVGYLEELLTDEQYAALLDASQPG
jgi:hypothetical protein